MSTKGIQGRLQFCNFKLESLLDVTTAINGNLSTEELLCKFSELIRNRLNIGRVLVFSYNKKWGIILSSGFDKTTYENIDVDKDLLPYDEITTTTSTSNPLLQAFDVIIPVFHNNKPISYVLIGDIEEEREGVSPTIKHLHFIQTLTNIIIVAMENRRLYEESLRQEAMKREMELASKMQAMLIPNHENLPRNEKIYIGAFYKPHYDVGGDYYDFIKLNENEYGFCIADVSGKGISAAILMSNFQANLRALFTSEIPLSDLIFKLNERVMANANGEKFITFFLGKYNYNRKQLSFINAGHNPPVFYKKGNPITFLKSGCIGLGMLDEIPFINEQTIDATNSKIITFTDGLVEIEDENEEQVGTKIIEEQIIQNKSIDQILADIIIDMNINDTNKSLFDDISILAAEFF